MKFSRLDISMVGTGGLVVKLVEWNLHSCFALHAVCQSIVSGGGLLGV